MHLIGTDGGAIASPIEMEEVLLTARERAELMVRANRPAGEYRVRNLRYDRTGNMTAMPEPERRVFRMGDTMNMAMAGGMMMGPNAPIQ